MRCIQFSIFTLLLFLSASLFAQKVHYKDKYYTLVNHKIFHRGYNVYAQLTEGQKDTIYMIATELYNDRGKLKPEYKKRRGSTKYKLPEGYWEQKEKELAQNASNNVKSTDLIESNTLQRNTESVSTKEESAKESTIEKTQDVINKEETIVTSGERKESSAEKKLKKNDTTQKKNVREDTSEKEKNKRNKKQKEQNDPKKSSVEQATSQKKSSGNDYKEKSDKKTNQKTEKQLKEKEEGASNKIEKQREQAERSVEKASEKLEKTTKNIEKQQAKLEKRENVLEKAKKSDAKKQKSIAEKELTMASAAVALASKKDEDFGTIYFKINKEKTAANQHGDIFLFFDVVNNSDKDLVILKPNNSVDNRIDFFSNTIECTNVPSARVVDISEEAEVTEKDFVTIPANSKIEFFVNGVYQNALACNAEDVVIQLQYNPFKDAEEGVVQTPHMKKKFKKVFAKITPIKIESENVKFKLNKQ